MTLAHCAFIFLFRHFFNPPFPPTCFIFPGHFLHGSVVSLFLQWIGFQLLSRAQRLLSPGFCHLYKTHCHFHSTSPSLPFYPLLLALCFYLLQGRVVCVCMCVRACVILILCSLIGLLQPSNIIETISANTKGSSLCSPLHFTSPHPAHHLFLSLCTSCPSPPVYCVNSSHLQHT